MAVHPAGAIVKVRLSGTQYLIITPPNEKSIPPEEAYVGYYRAVKTGNEGWYTFDSMIGTAKVISIPHLTDMPKLKLKSTRDYMEKLGL